MVMKKSLQITILSSLLLFPASALLAADTNMNSTTTTTSTSAPMHSNMMDVLSGLDSAGYSNVKSVELGANGTYKVKAIDPAGKKTEFVVSKPADIKKQTQTMKALTLSEAAKKVMDAGYTNITSIKAKSDHFNVKASDKNGKMVRLHVNIVTGAVSKEWF
jgi:hypothetical protein